MDEEEKQLQEAIDAARTLRDNVKQQVSTFPPEGAELGRKLLAAAEKTLLNLELARKALRAEKAASN